MQGARMTSREFNQNVSKAKRMAETGPVVITDRGEDSYVLVTYAEFDRLSKPGRSLREMLYSPEAADIDFEFEPSNIELRPVEFD